MHTLGRELDSLLCWMMFIVTLGMYNTDNCLTVLMLDLINIIAAIMKMLVWHAVSLENGRLDFNNFHLDFYSAIPAVYSR